MSYKKFCKILVSTIDDIINALGDMDLNFSQVGPALVIDVKNDKVDDVKKQIKSIVATNFEAKSSKFCKFNYHDSKLFMQFKRRTV